MFPLTAPMYGGPCRFRVTVPWFSMVRVFVSASPKIVSGQVTVPPNGMVVAPSFSTRLPDGFRLSL